MSPLLPSPRVRATVGALVFLALLGAGFLVLRSDHAEIQDRLGAPVVPASDRDGDRREIRERLVRTALLIAGHAEDWHLRPAAFGGGDGRWTGLTFDKIGFRADADGHYRTAEGAFSLRPEAGGLTVEAAYEPLDVRVVVVARGAARDGGLQFTVDGRPLDGGPAPTTRRALAPEAASEAALDALQREAQQLANFVTMVLESEPAESDVQRARSARRLTLADLGVETEPDGSFATPYGTLRLSWLTSRRGQVTGTNVHGSRVTVDVHAAVPRPEAGAGGETGVVPDPLVPPPPSPTARRSSPR